MSCVGSALSYPSTVIPQHCHISALSYLSTVIPQHCHISALSYLSTVIPQHCHTSALSYLSTVIPQHCHTSFRQFAPIVYLGSQHPAWTRSHQHHPDGYLRLFSPFTCMHETHQLQAQERLLFCRSHSTLATSHISTALYLKPRPRSPLGIEGKPERILSVGCRQSQQGVSQVKSDYAHFNNSIHYNEISSLVLRFRGLLPLPKMNLFRFPAPGPPPPSPHHHFQNVVHTKPSDHDRSVAATAGGTRGVGGATFVDTGSGGVPIDCSCQHGTPRW
ncbi:hypothetical protein N657DRAFT_71894 [Parathielavia appendiculata]|uniref:Uncharacterized protein n=1 Tax=Parathielavia appendiculata TaxID=2587402 RepID=A0AAN6UD33_9PEZI|nr:hypothetical protein N657DRAFT_71894 [Parathielavia appendiculata]